MLKKLKEKNRIKSIIKFLIIITFGLLSIMVAIKHENWSDEAQSYLLASDTNVKDLFHYMKYEGTPNLWVFVIKLFIILGGKYHYFYVISLFFSIVGLIIFEYKIEAPWYVKLLFPFTYFMFYQNTIIVRSYSMVFPLLMILAVLHKKRFDNPYRYALFLFLFMSISLHTLVVAGSIYLLMIIDIITMKKNNNEINKKSIYVMVVLFFCFLYTTIITYPNSDHSFYGNGGTNFFHIISEITWGSFLNQNLEIFLTILVCGVLLLINNLKDMRNLLILVFPLICIYMNITFQIWHASVLFFTFFYYLIITDKINKEYYCKIMFVSIILIQIVWNINSCIYDYKCRYSSAKDVYEFIVNNDLANENYTIYGVGYDVTAILPWFEKNILKNYNTEDRFYYWKLDNGYMNEKEMIDGNADVYIISNYYVTKYEELIDNLKTQNYYKKEFEAYLFEKIKTSEIKGYTLYIKNNINIYD